MFCMLNNDMNKCKVAICLSAPKESDTLHHVIFAIFEFCLFVKYY